MVEESNERPWTVREPRGDGGADPDLLAAARKADPLRTLVTVLAPADRRGELCGLVLLHNELARIAFQVSEPMPGLVRLQWWRDALAATAQGLPPAQPALRALAPALLSGRLGLEPVVAMVDAFEEELEAEPAGDLAALEDRLRATSGALSALMTACLGADAALLAAAREMGMAFGLVAMAGAGDAALRSPEELLDAAVAHVGRARDGLGRPERAQIAPLLIGRVAAAQAAMLRRVGPARPGEPLPRHPLLPLQLVLAWLLRRP